MWQKVSGRRGYTFYRKMVNGKGVWKAKKDSTGEEFSITYDQALGYEPIDQTEALAMHLGRLLLPH